MPNVKKGEKQNDYMARCVPVVMKEGKSQKAAIGQCYGMFKEKWKAKKTKASVTGEKFEEPTWEETEAERKKNGFIIDIF